MELKRQLLQLYFLLQSTKVFHFYLENKAPVVAHFVGNSNAGYSEIGNQLTNFYPTQTISLAAIKRVGYLWNIDYSYIEKKRESKPDLVLVNLKIKFLFFCVYCLNDICFFFLIVLFSYFLMNSIEQTVCK